MKKKLFVLGLVVALAVSLAGCATSTPAAGDAGSASPDQPPSSVAPPETSAPEEPESEPPSSEPETDTPKEKPTSIYLCQENLGYKGFLWQLRIEDEEELTLVEELLSTERLSPSREEDAMWPDGGIAILFEIYYENRAVTGACNPKYIDAPYNRERDAATYYSEEVFYDYPRERCEQLLAFLEGKGIEVQY